LGIFDRLFGKRPSSRDIAKERLQLVLIYDRAGLSPELLDTLRNEIVDVLSRYIEIERDSIELHLAQEGREAMLVANIPFRGRAKTPPSSPSSHMQE